MGPVSCPTGLLPVDVVVRIVGAAGERPEERSDQENITPERSIRTRMITSPLFYLNGWCRLAEASSHRPPATASMCCHRELDKDLYIIRCGHPPRGLEMLPLLAFPAF